MPHDGASFGKQCMVDETNLVSVSQTSDSNYHLDSTKSIAVRRPSEPISGNVERTVKSSTVTHDLLQVVKSLFQGCMMPYTCTIQRPSFRRVRQLVWKTWRTEHRTSQEPVSHLEERMRCRKLYFPMIWSKGKEWFLMFSLGLLACKAAMSFLQAFK